MNAQTTEIDQSFAILPPPDAYQFVNDQWIQVPQSTNYVCSSRIHNIFGEIKSEHDYLCQINETLTQTVRQLRQKNEVLNQMLQQRKRHLQAAQRHIGELNQEVKKSRVIAGQMQNWQIRLAACEQHISMFQKSFGRISQPTKLLSMGLQGDSNGRVPCLRRSARSKNLRGATPQSQQSPGQMRRSSVKKAPGSSLLA